jgi:hypothetical protein
LANNLCELGLRQHMPRQQRPLLSANDTWMCPQPPPLGENKSVEEYEWVPAPLSAQIKTYLAQYRAPIRLLY